MTSINSDYRRESPAATPGTPSLHSRLPPAMPLPVPAYPGLDLSPIERRILAQHITRVLDKVLWTRCASTENKEQLAKAIALELITRCLGIPSPDTAVSPAEATQPGALPDEWQKSWTGTGRSHAEPLTPDEMRAEWRAAGGKIYGPNVETVCMTETEYFAFRNSIQKK